jgi:hypothetical protein
MDAFTIFNDHSTNISNNTNDGVVIIIILRDPPELHFNG